MRKSLVHYSLYTDIDEYCCRWTRNLIAKGLIPPGDVLCCDIKEIDPDELSGYTQVHLFCGVAGFPYALSLASWPSSRSVLTGSCPCPSFSAAGKGQGFSDPRHLWPDMLRLIRVLKPSAIFGEQVAAAISHGWLDLVQSDLEASGYAVGSAVLGACSVGAPHRRQRLYFAAELLADPEREQLRTSRSGGITTPPGRMQGAHRKREWVRDDVREQRTPDLVANSQRNPGDSRRAPVLATESNGEEGARTSTQSGRCGVPDLLGHPEILRRSGRPDDCNGGRRELSSRPTSPYVELADSKGCIGGVPIQSGRSYQTDSQLGGSSEVDRLSLRPGPVNGFWADADWLLCTDGLFRAVEPSTQPLASGVPGRVGRLRGYGNSLTVQVAAEFIKSYMDATERDS